MIDAWGHAATRVEARLEGDGVGLTFVAARLRRILLDGPDISQPSVRLNGLSITVGFTIDDAEAFAPAVQRALMAIHRALEATGLPAATKARFTGVDILERSPGPPQPWSWEDFRQRAVDGTELRSILRWPRVHRLRAELELAVAEGVRRADAHARLDQALRRL